MLAKVKFSVDGNFVGILTGKVLDCNNPLGTIRINLGDWGIHFFMLHDPNLLEVWMEE